MNAPKGFFLLKKSSSILIIKNLGSMSLEMLSNVVDSIECLVTDGTRKSCFFTTTLTMSFIIRADVLGFYTFESSTTCTDDALGRLRPDFVSRNQGELFSISLSSCWQRSLNGS